MKKLLLLLLTCAVTVFAQSPPTTPNLGLYLPAHGSLNWDTWYDENWNILDNDILRLYGTPTNGDCVQFVVVNGTNVELGDAGAACGTGGGGSTTPGGSNLSIQFSSNGSFSGVYNNTTGSKGYLTQTNTGGNPNTPTFQVTPIPNTDLQAINLTSTGNGGVSGILPIVQGGTGTSSAPTLASGNGNCSISDTWPTWTITCTGSGGSGNGASQTYQLTDFNITTTSSTISVGSNCANASTACNVKLGNVVYNFYASPAPLVTLTGSQTTTVDVEFYNGLVVVNSGVTGSCNSNCTFNFTTTPQFDDGALPLYQCSTSSGSVSTCTREIAFLSSQPHLAAGNGITVTPNGANTNISVQSTLFTQSLTPTAVSGGACSDQTFTVTGLLTNTSVSVIPPSTFGSVSIYPYPSASNTLTLHLCNPTSGSVTPPSGTYTIRISY